MENMIEWIGNSGRKYQYWIYPIGAAFKDAPGNYIFAKETTSGSWEPIYIGETESLKTRHANHEKIPCVTRNGGTHIHAHVSSTSDDERRNEESDLLEAWDPPCNKD